MLELPVFGFFGLPLCGFEPMFGFGVVIFFTLYVSVFGARHQATDNPSTYAVRASRIEVLKREVPF